SGLHTGSKLIWAVAGEKRRNLGQEIIGLDGLPQSFNDVAMVVPGIVVLRGPAHNMERGVPDPQIESLAEALKAWKEREFFPLFVVVDDAYFASRNFANFLWVTFTRSDPATDVYGAGAFTAAKHWGCQAPLVNDARKKAFHAEELVDDEEVTRKIESLAAVGQPLYGLF
ncbi:MAG: 3-octaprenyl-4-hydroxybenzoate carboxy-lyase, partial [Desulfovibrio sp.]|nr:3-octaprenyl-4-hydroxybenzoate carboxy-lyase [Desulfovibrio sp.]